tara:strand:- start:9 stop:422 length:414 start_codon:yes stop_codon:yes gene_type:complete
MLRLQHGLAAPPQITHIMDADAFKQLIGPALKEVEQKASRERIEQCKAEQKTRFWKQAKNHGLFSPTNYGVIQDEHGNNLFHHVALAAGTGNTDAKAFWEYLIAHKDTAKNRKNKLGNTASMVYYGTIGGLNMVHTG